MIPTDNPFTDLIPRHWPAGRALALARLLRMGIEAIWDIYAEDMAEELMRPGSPWHGRIDDMTQADPMGDEELSKVAMDEEIPF